jgi:hypothetical protein
MASQKVRGIRNWIKDYVLVGRWLLDTAMSPWNIRVVFMYFDVYRTKRNYRGISQFIRTEEAFFWQQLANQTMTLPTSATSAVHVRMIIQSAWLKIRLRGTFWNVFINCKIFRVRREVCTDFSNIWNPPQNSSRQIDDMKLVQQWRSYSIKW